MDVIIWPPNSLPFFIKDRCPSCRFPIVGTYTMGEMLFLSTRKSVIELKIFNFI